jgi:superfamily I DNA and/or RNA helicase
VSSLLKKVQINVELDGPFPLEPGKTKTMVELVLQILAHNPDAHVLVTAPSNPATDTLTLRLMRYLDNNTMLRLQGPERTFAETPSNIMTYSCVQDNRFAGQFGVSTMCNFTTN